jgi:hypothetical protein
LRLRAVVADELDLGVATVLDAAIFVRRFGREGVGVALAIALAAQAFAARLAAYAPAKTQG